MYKHILTQWVHGRNPSTVAFNKNSNSISTVEEQYNLPFSVWLWFWKGSFYEPQSLQASSFSNHKCYYLIIAFINSMLWLEMADWQNLHALRTVVFQGARWPLLHRRGLIVNSHSALTDNMRKTEWERECMCVCLGERRRQQSQRVLTL